MSVTILIPVLRRPQNILPLVTSIDSSTPRGTYDILFIASPDDHEELGALRSHNQNFITMDRSYENRGDYARKINRGFASVTSEWYFLGADDLRFHPGWFGAAMDVHKRMGACAIGTNDLGSPIVMRGQHATHSLVLGEYARDCGTIDEPGKVLHEGYPHEFVDTEFVETAKCRGAWAFARNSRVEHLHPNWKKGVMDSLYAAQPDRMQKGRTIYDRRKHLWN